MTLKEYEEWVKHFKTHKESPPTQNRWALLNKKWAQSNKQERNTIRKIASKYLKNYHPEYET